MKPEAMMNQTMGLPSVALLAVLAATGQASAISLLPPCEAVQLSLVLDDGQHPPDSDTQGGTRLVVHNRSTAGCRILGLPPVVFRDTGGRALPIERRVPPGMHPGPVVLPASLPPGDWVDARLGWLSGGTLPGGRCYSPATIEIAIGGHAVSHSFQGSLCASPGQPAMFTQSWFRWKASKDTTR